MSEDPSVKLEIDQDAFDYVNDQVNQLADTIEQDEEAKAQVAKQEQTTEEQALAQQDDPRNAEKWGFKALVKEGQSVAADGFKAPGVVVSYTQDADIQNGSKFAAKGMQIAAGVPLACDEPEEFKTFRLGLFGLDKLYDVEGTFNRLKKVLDQVL